MHTQQSGAFLGFSPVQHKDKKKWLSGFFPELSWAGWLKIFLFHFSLILFAIPHSATRAILLSVVVFSPLVFVCV